jgi:mono/diheme cytochrome c family protein
VGRYLIGAVVGLALAMTLAFTVSRGGWVNVGAQWPDPPPLAWWLHTSYEKAVARRAADIRAPDDLDDPASVLAGARAFEEMCSICHTPPGLSPTVQSQGLNPAPPQLSRMLSRRTPAQAFWVIQNGVRMTGMPAFGPSHSDAQLWQLVAFLKQAAGMDAAGYAQIQEQVRQRPAGDGHHHRHGGVAGEAMTGRGDHHARHEPADPAQPAGDHHDH